MAGDTFEAAHNAASPLSAYARGQAAVGGAQLWPRVQPGVLRGLVLGLTNIFRNLIQNKVVGEKSGFFKILIKIKYISIKTLIEIKCISTE